jgi:endonuclease III
MPTLVSVFMKKEPGTGTWSVNGYKEAKGYAVGHNDVDVIDVDVLDSDENYSVSDDDVCVTSCSLDDENNVPSVQTRGTMASISRRSVLTHSTNTSANPSTAHTVSMDGIDIPPSHKALAKKTKKKKAKVISRKPVRKKSSTTLQVLAAPNQISAISETSEGTKAICKQTVTHMPVIIRPPLPGKSLKDWLQFGDRGCYSLTTDEWLRVRGWVCFVHNNKDFVAEAITFHRLVVRMKSELGLESARDCWSKVLPNPNEQNYPICVLVLMLCTPMVPDTKIIDVFGPFFRNNTVDEDWIIKQGEKAIARILRPLGRQNDSAKYVVQAAIQMKALSGLPRDYRDLVQFNGAGPKVALVTLHEAIGCVQGVPCDVHMCRIFAKLGWIPKANTDYTVVNFISNHKKEQHNYELCRASIEGWFPREFWGTLNQTWAGLGQLLNDPDAKQRIASYIDENVADYTSNWRVADKKKFFSIMEAYSK